MCDNWSNRLNLVVVLFWSNILLLSIYDEIAGKLAEAIQNRYCVAMPFSGTVDRGTYINSQPPFISSRPCPGLTLTPPPWQIVYPFLISTLPNVSVAAPARSSCCDARQAAEQPSDGGGGGLMSCAGRDTGTAAHGDSSVLMRQQHAKLAESCFRIISFCYAKNFGS